MNFRGKIFAPRAVLASLALLALLLIFHFKVKRDMVDFEVNYKAGKRLSSAQTLYQPKDGHYMFKYPPPSAFLYLPLSALPLDVAKAIWYFSIIVCSFFLFHIANKILPFKKREPVFLIAIPPLILARYFLRELQLGQINALVTLISLLMIWFLARENKARIPLKETWAGIFWGLGITLKPYVLIFLPYFLVKKKWRTLGTGLGLFFLAILAPSFCYGFFGNIRVLKDWISTFSKSSQALLASQDNISVTAFFIKWTGNRNMSLLISGVMLTLLAFLVLRIVLKGKKKPQAFVLECSILLTLIPLVSPLGWDYTLLMSFLGVVIVTHNFYIYPKFWRIFLIVNFFIITFSLYDILGRERYAVFMSWNIITLNFLILIGYLAFLRFKKIY